MFIFLSTDAFSGRSNKIKAERDLFDHQNKRESAIRRPYRGIQIKDDTYSTISVRKSDGSPIYLVSSSDRTVSINRTEGRVGKVAEYADYIIQNVQEQRTEKQQIIETFGDPYVYFFGERPRILSVSGLLMNTEDFDWRSQFWENYDKHFRGTKLVQQNARVYLSFDTIIVEGYILDASAVDNADMPYSIPFNFSMLITNYYNWATIGQTLFPSSQEGLGDFRVLNQELEELRSKFVSSGAQVRLKNLLADPGGGVLATLRSGIRAVNEAVSFVGGLTDKIHNVIGGRTVRVPIGIAGFLQSTGAAQIGAGSIGGSRILSAEGLGHQFDAATGEFKGVRGSVKLRMPGNALYAPPWISELTGTARGYIHENVDEYPTLRQPEHISELLRLGDYSDLLARRLHRQMAVEYNDVLLLEHNLMAEAGGILGTIAEAVSFAKSAFGMVMTAAAFISDPLNSVKASLGIGIGTTSQSRITGRADELQKRGIKVAGQEGKSILGRTGEFIGGSALRTFKNVVTSKVEDPIPASLRDTYNTAAYQQQLADAKEGDLAYEPAYDDKIYETSLADRLVLEEVHGNRDTPPGSDVAPASLEEVYGTGSAASAIRTPEEIAAALQAAQAEDVEADEDTSGIIGAEDPSAKIDPIV